MNICLFTDEEIKNGLPVTDSRCRHLLNILHKKEGDSFCAGIINGEAGTAVIKKISESKIEFDFIAESEGKVLLPLKLIVGFPRPIQLKRLLRDIASLGACEVHLTGTELGEKSYMNSSLAEPEAASKLLQEGSVQAASTHIPSLFIHRNVRRCLSNMNLNDNQIKIFLDNVKPEFSLPRYLSGLNETLTGKETVAAIGSERGWTDLERKIFKSFGFISCGMGERVLRTETAASAAAAVILAYSAWNK